MWQLHYHSQGTTCSPTLMYFNFSFHCMFLKHKLCSSVLSRFYLQMKSTLISVITSKIKPALLLSKGPVTVSMYICRLRMGHQIAISTLYIPWLLPSPALFLIKCFVPITWSTSSTLIFSNSVLFQTYFEFWCLLTHSWIRSLPSSLSPFLSGYSGSVWFLCMSFLRPPANTTSMPSP